MTASSIILGMLSQITMNFRLSDERNKVGRKYRMFHNLADKYDNNKNLSDFHGGANKSAFKNDEPHRFAKEAPPKYPNTNVTDRRDM